MDICETTIEVTLPDGTSVRWQLVISDEETDQLFKAIESVAGPADTIMV